MSQEPAETHISEQQIDKLGMLREFGEWLRRTPFQSRGGFLECVDTAEVQRKCEPLLNAFGYQVQEYNKLIFDTLLINKQRGTYRFNALRRPGRPAAIDGPADLIPVNVLTGIPTISGRSLTPGEIIHIDGSIKLEADLDFILVVTN